MFKGKRLKEVETMMMLFGKELESLSGNVFDGSKEEHQIFVDIFYRCSAENARNSCCVSWASSLQRADALDSHRKALDFKLENSNISTYFSVKDSSGESLQHAKKMNARDASRSEFIHESSSSWAGSCPQKLKAKKSKISFSEIPNHENEETSCSDPGSTSELLQDDSFRVLPFMSQGDFPQDHRPSPFRVVESFAHGILSSYFSFNRQKRRGIASNSIDDNIIMNYQLLVQQIEESKAIMEVNTVTSPVSQESIASGLLIAGPVLNLTKVTAASTGMKQNVLEAVQSHTIEGTAKKTVNREMPDCLESSAHRLLIDAGWRIEPRIRRERNKPAFCFKNPEGLVLSSLSRAWKACGERLLQTASESEKDDNGREWSNFNKFSIDLKDVIAYIDKKSQQQRSSLSILRRWQLLDPFVAVVFIHRKVSALKTGKLLRAVKSEASVFDCGKDIYDEAVNMIENQSMGTQSYFDPLNQHKHDLKKRKSCSTGGSCKTNMKAIAGHAGKVSFDVKYGPHVNCKSLPSQKKKTNCLSCKCKLSQKYLLDLNSAKTLDNFGTDSPVSSGLESGDACGNIEVLAENEVNHETVSEKQMPSLYLKGNRLSEESDEFCEKEECFHGDLLDNFNEAASHLEGAGAFASKDTSLTKMVNGLLKKTNKKSKKISEIGATEVIGRKRSGRKVHRENSVCGLDDRNSDGLGLPNYEASDLLASDCLQQSEYFNKQCGNFLSNSEEIKSLASAIQGVSPKKKVHKTTIQPEKKTFGTIKKDDKGIQAIPLDGKPSILFMNEDESQDDRLLHNLVSNECTARMSSDDFSSARSLQKLQSKSKKSKCLDLKENSIPEGSCAESSSGEVLSATDVPSCGFEESQKVSKANRSDIHKKSGRKRPRGLHVNDDDLLIAAIIKNKDFGSSCKKAPEKPVIPLPEVLRKLKSKKGGCRLLLRALGSAGKLSVDGKRFVMGARTVLCWLIDMGAASLKDIVQFRNPKNNQVIKDGWVTRDGILCKCCNQILSVSHFKAHAGFRQQKPSLTLYMQSGKSYTLCQLQAWSTEYKARNRRSKVIKVQEVDQNDDTCGICGDGGELICCDRCPSTYHQACLSEKELPEGSWYCSNCTCKTCSNVVSRNECSNSIDFFECSQCEHKYHGRCIKANSAHYADVGSTTWFCGENCHELYMGLRSRVGVVNSIDDGFSWTILRCNHEDQNVYSLQKIALMAECNSKLAIALTLMEECFLPIVDPRTGINMIPHVLYNWGSNFPRLNYQGFYTVILEKCDTLISAASVRVHGVTVAEMPLIATCGQHRRQGMCTRLLDAIEMMLKSFKVEMLVLSAIPSLVETWISGFGFSAVDDEENEVLKSTNLMLFPGTVLLKKKLCEASFEETSGCFLCSDSPGRIDQFHSTNDKSEICEGVHERNKNEKEQPSAENGEKQLVVESLLLNCTNLEEGQGHSLQGDLSMLYCGELVTTSNENRLPDFTLAVCSDVESVPVSREMLACQVVLSQMPTANMAISTHSYTTAKFSDEPLTKLNSILTDENMQEVEEKSSKGAIVNVDIASDALIEARTPSSEGNVVVQESTVNATEGTNFGCLFELETSTAPGFSELNLESCIIGKDLVDDPCSDSKGEMCGFTERQPVSKE